MKNIFEVIWVNCKKRCYPQSPFPVFYTMHTRGGCDLFFLWTFWQDIKRNLYLSSSFLYKFLVLRLQITQYTYFKRDETSKKITLILFVDQARWSMSFNSCKYLGKNIYERNNSQRNSSDKPCFTIYIFEQFNHFRHFMPYTLQRWE